MIAFNVQLRALTVCVLISASCARRPGSFRVVPAQPDYVLHDPASRQIPFPDVLRTYNGFEQGRAWVDLCPGIELRIENAYYEPGMSRHGLAGFLSTEVAQYKMKSGIEAVYSKPKLSRRGESHRIYPYPLRGVSVEQCDYLWSTDITYIRLTRGFLYLGAVMDWFSRYVLSWRLSASLDQDFCVEASRSALSTGQPRIFNSKRQPVHQRNVHGRTGGAEDRDQHEWLARFRFASVKSKIMHLAFLRVPAIDTE